MRAKNFFGPPSEALVMPFSTHCVFHLEPAPAMTVFVFVNARPRGRQATALRPAWGSALQPGVGGAGPGRCVPGGHLLASVDTRMFE
jgi:hypothetical protein